MRRSSKGLNIQRDGKSVYNKVHNLIKAMNHFLRTRRKPKTCHIIHENKIIRSLVRKICDKTKERDDGREENEGTTRDFRGHGNINMTTKYDNFE